jgi:hypothetical protein
MRAINRRREASLRGGAAAAPIGFAAPELLHGQAAFSAMVRDLVRFIVPGSRPRPGFRDAALVERVVDEMAEELAEHDEGCVAGSPDNKGALRVGIKVDGRSRFVKLHRAVFAIRHGRWPTGRLTRETYTRTEDAQHQRVHVGGKPG